MEEKSETEPSLSPPTDDKEVLESPRTTAFTIDFGDDNRKVDFQRHKSLSEKFQKRHKRGKSMSKLESASVENTATSTKKYPLTGNMPRKSSLQFEDERTNEQRCKSANVASSNRIDLTLPLERTTSDRMTHSFPNAALLSLTSPSGVCDLQNVSSPEFELISPFSPLVDDVLRNVNSISLSSEEANIETNFSCNDLADLDRKSDTVSEAGTYTLEVDNYSEEQKARMSIDNDFKIEPLSVEDKTQEYIKSLSIGRFLPEGQDLCLQSSSGSSAFSSMHSSFSGGHPIPPVPPLKPHPNERPVELLFKGPTNPSGDYPLKKVLSPILSPTQNVSIAGGDCAPQHSPGHAPLTKLMPKVSECSDSGAIISVTSSGVFRTKAEEKRRRERNRSLTKSEVHVEAYVDGRMYSEQKSNNVTVVPRPKNQLTVNVQNIEVVPGNGDDPGNVVSASLVFGKMGNVATVTTGLPPVPTEGKTSPSKIPSPIHTLSRPRSRSSISALADDFDTEMILKPTRNYINSLQRKLSLDNSDPDSDYEIKLGMQLNNTAHLLKQRALHTRHNSLDDTRTINNKLEHFQSKNLQAIDQTYTNVFNQYGKQNNVVVNKINNSPSNSPVRRSSSFSNRNQMFSAKSTNMVQKGSNCCASPSLGKNERIQRSSSTANIKPGFAGGNARLGVVEHKKIDRSQFGDTESSSEEDLDPNLQKKKDLGSLTNTRCNRTFSLRRARVDNEAANKLKCPNTPDMRRKTFGGVGTKPERAISMDRKPVKTNEVQSRYLLSLNKRATSIPKELPKPASKPPCPSTKPAVALKAGSPFSRETGRFSMRTQKPSPVAVGGAPKTGVSKKDGKHSKQNNGGRSNSSLSSREVEFQNWKRRKTYDPMKAAAEGKRKELEKRLSGMTGNAAKTGASPDSSPSHSGSVHRSQSFHGTAALEQLISSDEEEDATDEGFSPPTPSPCDLSPTKATLRHTLWDRIHNN
ncbi:uncharacterized protein LOC126747383 [Anthonomus grandis grandis]|uniref:uncharacterized protein LOC126747383 n=1 Tax=Anthonomus grandis grandis TaxID=2921223 RepID=UPI0021652BD7|nr:uncharacterized protein LOC126747383 [Anthonomus grandis grandis]